MKLITGELREFIHSRAWPPGDRLVLDIDQKDWVGGEYLPHLEFILYRDNFNMFTTEEQMQIANVMQELLKKIRDSGIPTTLEVKQSCR